MFKYRKKPVVIEAFQYQPDTDKTGAVPKWFVDKVLSGDILQHDDNSMSISTLEGDMAASPGDYIIQGIKGEIYPCKPDIFELTYEAV